MSSLRIALTNGLVIDAPVEVWVLAMLQGVDDVAAVVTRVAAIQAQQRLTLPTNGGGVTIEKG